jgi:hypothetical protein
MRNFILTKLITKWRSIEDLFLLPSKNEHVLDDEPFVTDKIRIQFRKTVLIWIAMITLPLSTQWWMLALIASSGAILHLSYFVADQEISNKGPINIRGKPHLEPIFYPVINLAVFLFTVYFISSLVNNVFGTLFFVLGVTLVIGIFFIAYVFYKKISKLQFWEKIDEIAKNNSLFNIFSILIRFSVLALVLFSAIAIMLFMISSYNSFISS